MVIKIEKAKKLLEYNVNQNRDHFGNPDDFLSHSYDSLDISTEMIDRFIEDYGVDSNLRDITRTGALLHDIGRCFTKDKQDHTFHEIEGPRYLERVALEQGIASSVEEAKRIAQSFRSHFVVYEQFLMKALDSYYGEFKLGLNDTNPKLLLPTTLIEAIIIYSELTNVRGERISFDKRLKDIKKRDKAKNSPRLIALERGEGRLYQIKEDIEGLLNHTIKKENIFRKYPLL